MDEIQEKMDFDQQINISSKKSPKSSQIKVSGLGWGPPGAQMRLRRGWGGNEECSEVLGTPKVPSTSQKFRAQGVLGSARKCSEVLGSARNFLGPFLEVCGHVLRLGGIL